MVHVSDSYSILTLRCSSTTEHPTNRSTNITLRRSHQCQPDLLPRVEQASEYDAENEMCRHESGKGSSERNRSTYLTH